MSINVRGEMRLDVVNGASIFGTEASAAGILIVRYADMVEGTPKQYQMHALPSGSRSA